MHLLLGLVLRDDHGLVGLLQLSIRHVLHDLVLDIGIPKRLQLEERQPALELRTLVEPGVLRSLRHQLQVHDGVDEHAPLLRFWHPAQFFGECLLRQGNIALRHLGAACLCHHGVRVARRFGEGCGGFGCGSGRGGGRRVLRTDGEGDGGGHERGSRDGRHHSGHARHQQLLFGSVEGVGTGRRPIRQR